MAGYRETGIDLLLSWRSPQLLRSRIYGPMLLKSDYLIA